MSEIGSQMAVLEELGLGAAAGAEEIAAAIELKRGAVQRRLARASTPLERQRHEEALARLQRLAADIGMSGGSAEKAVETGPDEHVASVSVEDLPTAEVPPAAVESAGTPAHAQPVEPLTREEVLRLLSLGNAATAVEIRAAYELMRPVLKRRAGKASGGDRSDLETTIERLDAAMPAIAPSLPEEKSTEDLPGSEPSPKNGVEPFREKALSRSQGLSLTQMRDLPGAAPFQTGMKSRGGSAVATRIGLQPGTVLADRYEIIAQIGAGGMGAVYSAFDRNRQEEIAIKVLLPELMENKQAREQFLTEAQVSTKLSHPNIVKVYDVQKDGSLFFLTMELLQGRTLRQELVERKARNRPFDVTEVRSIAKSLCSALDHAHQYTVHRDIKPENIWVSTDGSEKLMDFGIARAMRSSGTTMTMTGAAMGTAYYMAPEQLNGAREIDKRADQYALAAVLYEMLTLEIPAGRIKSVRSKRSNVPQTLSNALDRALEVKPDDRFTDIVAFQGSVCKGGVAITRAMKMTALAAAASVVLGVSGVMLVNASSDGVGSMFAKLMRNQALMAQAEKAKHGAETAKAEWQKLRELLQKPEPPEAVAAGELLDRGLAEFNKASDGEALRLFVSATEGFQELSSNTQTSYRPQALELQEILGRQRKNLEKAHEAFEARVREGERAGGAPFVTLTRWRDRINAQVYDNNEFQQLAARMRVGESFLQDKKYAEATRAFLDVRQAGDTLLKLENELESTALAEYGAEGQRAEWNKLAPKALLPSSDTMGPTLTMIKGQTAVNTQDYAAARVAFTAAREGFSALLLKGQQAIVDRETARVEAEKAAQESARRQAAAAAENARARAEAERQRAQGEQLEAQRQMQQRQMEMQQRALDQQAAQAEAQRKAQETQMMMQGITSIFGAIGGMGRRY